MIVDCYFFFAYIISGVIFTTVAYLIKFNPTSKNEELLLMDDNPWNDKDTEDFLRHLKLEFFLFCYFMAVIMLDAVFGFFPGRDFGSGPIVWDPIKIILVLDIAVKANNLIITCTLSATKSKVEDKRTKAVLIFLALFDWTMLGVIFYYFRKSDNLADLNIFCRIWIQTIMIGLIIEPIWILAKLQIEEIFLNRLIKKMYEKHPELAQEENEDVHHQINQTEASDDSDGGNHHEGGDKHHTNAKDLLKATGH